MVSPEHGFANTLKSNGSQNPQNLPSIMWEQYMIGINNLREANVGTMANVSTPHGGSTWTKVSGWICMFVIARTLKDFFYLQSLNHII